MRKFTVTASGTALAHRPEDDLLAAIVLARIDALNAVGEELLLYAADRRATHGLPHRRRHLITFTLLLVGRPARRAGQAPGRPLHAGLKA